MAESLAVSVPGTTSNLAHGFDCLGAALDLTNTTRAAAIDGHVCTGDTGLVTLAQRVRQAASEAWSWSAPALDISITGAVPIARGLGSSATILLAIAAIYQRLAEREFDREELLRLTIPLEGHPDNLVAAAYGGLAVATPQVVDGAESWRYRNVTLPADWRAVVVVPDHEVRTAEARATLPSSMNLETAVRSWQHLAWLVAALCAGDVKALRGAFAEGWHEHYRQQVNPRLAPVREAADSAGAIGTFLSGSGSTVLALCENETSANDVVDAIRNSNAIKTHEDASVVPFSQNGMHFVDE